MKSYPMLDLAAATLRIVGALAVVATLVCGFLAVHADGVAPTVYWLLCAVGSVCSVGFWLMLAGLAGAVRDVANEHLEDARPARPDHCQEPQALISHAISLDPP